MIGRFKRGEAPVDTGEPVYTLTDEDGDAQDPYVEGEDGDNSELAPQYEGLVSQEEIDRHLAEEGK